MNKPQRAPSQHGSVIRQISLWTQRCMTLQTAWHLGHSRCARTNMGVAVVPQHLQRGGPTLADLSLVGTSDIATQ